MIRRPSPRAIACFLTYLAALAAALVPMAWVPATIYDEFTILSDGWRLASGEVMYRDFFEFVTPLSPAIAALAFAVAGPGILAPRLVQAALLVLAGALFYFLGRRYDLPRPLAVLPGLIFAFAGVTRWPVYSHHWLVVPFVLGAAAAALQGLDHGGRRWWALAGTSAGLAVLVLQSDGLAAAGVVAAMPVAAALLGGTPWRLAARWGAAALAGLALPLGLAAAYFAWHGALGDLWEATWVFPTTQYRAAGNTNNVPFGSDFVNDLPPGGPSKAYYLGAFRLAMGYLLMAAMPLLALLWGLAAIVRRVRTAAPLPPADIRLGLLALATVASFAVLVKGRADTTHVFCHLPFSLVLAAVLAHRWAARFDGPRLLAVRWLPAAALAAFAAAGAFEHGQMMRGHVPAILAGRTPEQVLARDPVLRWVVARTAPGDRIAAFPWGGFFYLLGRPPGVGYSLLYPPELRYNSPAQFAEAKAELAARRPRLVLTAAPPNYPGGPFDPYGALLPPDYRLVHVGRSKLFLRPVRVYERP